VINGFGADLHGDLRTAFEVERPRELFGRETRFVQGFDGFFNSFSGDDYVHIRRGHRFARPMVDGQTANHAPRHFQAFQRFDEQRNIAAAARCLPVIELPHGHAKRSTPTAVGASGNSNLTEAAKLPALIVKRAKTGAGYFRHTYYARPQFAETLIR
jgi:hypothetical protein